MVKDRNKRTSRKDKKIKGYIHRKIYKLTNNKVTSPRATGFNHWQNDKNNKNMTKMTKKMSKMTKKWQNNRKGNISIKKI